MPVFSLHEETHVYTLDAEVLPSPSSVFADLGLVDASFFTPGSRARGKAVHAGLHYALKGTLDWKTLDPDLHGYVKSGLRLVERLGPTITRFETPLYHPLLHFAGTSDLEWDLGGWRWTVDWKSGKASKVVRYQTAAYEVLARVQAPLFNRWKRAAVELQADGSVANLVKYDDHTDGLTWLQLLGAYRVRQNLRVAQLAHIPGEETYVPRD